MPLYSSSSLIIEYLVQALQDPITDVVHSKMKPLIQEFRDSAEGLLKDQNVEMYGTIWERVKGALILLRTISDKLEVGQRLLRWDRDRDRGWCCVGVSF